MMNVPGEFSFSPKGWECPKCGGVMSPSMPNCSYCKPKQEYPRTSGWMGTISFPETQKLPSCIHGIVGECMQCKFKPILGAYL